MTRGISAADPMFVFDDVSVTAGEVTILDRVTLKFAAGEPTVLIGPNGAGKTTLLRTAMGLTRPLRGRVIWSVHADQPTAQCSIMFQRPAMLRRSVGGNILYALRAAGIPRKHRRARVDALLSEVGLESLVARPARRLSTGEQHRLALARALASDPAVLFLDEPTASLDPAATKAIEDVIRAASRSGIKVILSTHDLGEARRLAGEIVLLNRGRVIETGPASAFFQAPQTVQARKFLAGELLL